MAWAMRKLTCTLLHNSSATTKKGGENLVLDGEPLLLEETLAQHWPAAHPLVQIKCVKAHHSFVHTGWSQGLRFPGYKQVVLREGRVLKRKQAWIMNQVLHVAQQLLVGWGALPLIPPIVSHLIPPSMSEASTVALTLSTHCAVVAAVCWFRLAAYFGGRELSRLNLLQESFHLCLELRLHATHLVWKVLLHNVNGCLFGRHQKSHLWHRHPRLHSSTAITTAGPSSVKVLLARDSSISVVVRLARDIPLVNFFHCLLASTISGELKFNNRGLCIWYNSATLVGQ